MRTILAPFVVVAALASVIACTKSHSTPAAEDAAKQQAALEAAKAAGALPNEAVAAPSEDAAAAGAVAEEEKPTKVDLFEELLKKSGFEVQGRLVLLPDLLGGLDECDAIYRTKLEAEVGYATLGLYPDAKKAEVCLENYLKLPGAARFAHLYERKGPYILEMSTKLTAPQLSNIKEVFGKTLAE